MYADYEMADIVLKACAFKPEDRYQTPQELQEALLEYGKRNEASDALIVPPIEGEPEQIDPSAEEEVEPVQFADTEQMADDFKESFSPDTAMLNAIIDEVHRGEAGQNTLDLDENSQDASEDDADNSSSSEDAEVDELKINLPPRTAAEEKGVRAKMDPAGLHWRGRTGCDCGGGMVLCDRPVCHARQLRLRDGHRHGLSDRSGRIRRGQRRI